MSATRNRRGIDSSCGKLSEKHRAWRPRLFAGPQESAMRDNRRRGCARCRGWQIRTAPTRQAVGPGAHVLPAARPVRYRLVRHLVEGSALSHGASSRVFSLAIRQDRRSNVTRAETENLPKTPVEAGNVAYCVSRLNSICVRELARRLSISIERNCHSPRTRLNSLGAKILSIRLFASNASA
jgi:hypothetical protein